MTDRVATRISSRCVRSAHVVPHTSAEPNRRGPKGAEFGGWDVHHDGHCRKALSFSERAEHGALGRKAPGGTSTRHCQQAFGCAYATFHTMSWVGANVAPHRPIRARKQTHVFSSFATFKTPRHLAKECYECPTRTVPTWHSYHHYASVESSPVVWCMRGDPSSV